MLATRRRDPGTDLLSTVELFRGCSKRELAVIARLTTPADVRGGTVLCREGQRGVQAFVIVTGEASVTIDGTEVARLGPGAICGEMALLGAEVRSATVTAVGAMTLLALSTSDFRQLMDAAPTVVRNMLAAMSSRLRSAQMK